jgi:hypothetical protein
MPSPTMRLSMPNDPPVVVPPMLRPKWILSIRSGADTPQKLPDAGNGMSAVEPSPNVIYA